MLDDDVLRAFRDAPGGERLELHAALRLEWGSTPSGPMRQLVCADDVGVGEVLVRLPRALALGAPLPPVVQSAFDAACEARAAPTMLRQTLGRALDLLTTARPSWTLYSSRLLPDEAASDLSSDSFTSVELAELQSEPLAERIRASRALLDAVYDAFDWSTAGMPARFSRERFVWAVHCVRSRAFAVRRCEGETQLLLCPFIDLVNHCAAANARADFAADLDECVLVATQPIRAGDEIVRDYAHGSPVPASNERMLYAYGFVAQQNAHDELYLSFRDEIALALDEARRASTSETRAGAGAASARRRVQLLLRAPSVEGQSRGVAAIRARDLAQPPLGAWSSQAMYLARALCATDRELVSSTALAILAAGRPVSRANEREAAQLVWRKLVALVAAFPTTIADDEQRLRERSEARGASHAADRTALALQLRISRKVLVESALCVYARYRRSALRPFACAPVCPPSSHALRCSADPNSD